MVKIKQNDIEQTIAVPSAVSIGVNGWDTSIEKSTNGVENRAFTLARNTLLSDNQYNSNIAYSVSNAKNSLADDNYTPLQKDTILDNVSIPNTNVVTKLHALNARSVGLTKAYTAESPVTISDNRISDDNGFDYPSMYIPNEDDFNPANIVYTKTVSGYRGATVSGYDITAEDLEGDYVEQASYTGFITTINANLLFNHSSSGNYLTFTQGDLNQDVEPFTGRLCVTRGTLTEIDATWALPSFSTFDVCTYNSSGSFVAEVWDGHHETSNGDVLTSKGVLTTSTLPVEIMLLSDGRWLLLPNQVIATGNIYDDTTGNIYGAFTVFSDLSWIANWYWKPTKNPSDNLVDVGTASVRNASNNYMSITQTAFGQTTSYTSVYTSGGSIFSRRSSRTIDTSTASSQLGQSALLPNNYSWCQNSYTRGYFMQVRSV